MKVIKSSPEGTPEEEILFAIEYPATTRIKMTLSDVVKTVAENSDQITKLQAKNVELEDIKKEMIKLI